MAKRKPDLRKLAKRQRWMIWLVLLNILSQCVLSPWVNFGVGGLSSLMVGVLALLSIVVHVLMIGGVVLLVAAMGAHPVWIVLFGVLMLAPCANLIVLVGLNMYATHMLRRAGLRVGLMGANLSEVERVLNPLLCKGCGYNLTGNVSGYCPECGRSIDQLIPHPGGELLDTT